MKMIQNWKSESENLYLKINSDANDTLDTEEPTTNLNISAKSEAEMKNLTLAMQLHGDYQQ